MNQAPQETLHWDLTDLYSSPDDSRLGDDMGRAAALAEQIERSYRGRLSSLGAVDLAEAIALYERLIELAYRPQMYAQLLFAGQTTDEKAQALLDRSRRETTEAFNQVKFFEVELKKLPEEQFKALLEAPGLASYRHFLAAMRRFAPYTLSEAEEQISELKNLTGRAAFSQLYTEVSSRLRIPVEVEGKSKELTVAEARALRSSPDRELRRRATDGLMHAFEGQGHVLNFCFNTLFQDHAVEVKLRGYPSACEPTYLEDELPEELVERLLDTTERHYPLAQRFMRLKAKALQLSDFSSHDVLAPLPGSERKVPFEEARETVLEAFRKFEPGFAAIAREFFERRWIDAMPQPGKRDGAFCSGMLPSLHPYVLLNYNHRIEDVSTLAHELGHGVHFYLSRRNTPVNFWAATPMAETASVFAELLLMKRLLEAEKDRGARRSLLSLRIEDIVATVFNQVSYTRWEQRAHARREQGVLPLEELAKLWMEERRRLYGDSVQLFPRDRFGWLGIGHFVHYRFYCYSYALGQLLVLALFRRYEEEGAPFIPRYQELLSSGCSDTPQRLLSRIGIELEDSSFWERGFHTLSGLLDEFEALI
ncbi:MAG: M3 family oligoendopeptidase [Myxococcales bacterium]|nr:M3 family oligoendopeptidase [Myxococcales bacterium]